MSTTQTLYENEHREIELLTWNEDETTFAPSSATATVYNSSHELVIVITCTIATNVTTAIITTTVTGTPGEYYILWRLVDSSSYIYFHRTELIVAELRTTQ